MGFTCSNCNAILSKWILDSRDIEGFLSACFGGTLRALGHQGRFASVCHANLHGCLLAFQVWTLAKEMAGWTSYAPQLARNNLLTAPQVGDLAVEGVQVQLSAANFGHLLCDSQVPLELLKCLQEQGDIGADILVLSFRSRISLPGDVHPGIRRFSDRPICTQSAIVTDCRRA